MPQAINFSNINVASIPLALYIHIPWCVKKCPYCDFNSHTLPANKDTDLLDENNTSRVDLNKLNSNKLDLDNVDLNNVSLNSSDYFDEYVTALIKDIDAQLPLVQNRNISSIFIGGGTPSLLPIKQYHRLFAHLRRVLTFAADIEVTMEANPGTLEHAPFTEYLEVGINRLSIGVQSFNDDHLQALGRIHNTDQAFNAIQAASAAGFERINVDLMHGLPKQTLKQALCDITQAHEAGATHISWYQLTIEPNTVFYRDTPILPKDDDLAVIEAKGSALLSKLGYRNYEVSAWAGKRDIESQHNVNYWQFGDYLAIGAGAHGKVTVSKSTTNESTINNNGANNNEINNSDASPYLSDVEERKVPGIYRFSKSRLPKDYVTYNAYPKMVGWHAIDDDEIAGEFMLNVLRLTAGVPLSIYALRTGQSLDSILPQIRKLQQKGLLSKQEDIIQPTALGRRYLNQVLQEFM